MDFLEKYKLLSNHQYGFRRGKSTEDAVLFLTETVSSHLDRGQRCLGVFLDLARAFDSLSIKILLEKLECIGIRGITLDWFSSYLLNRCQYVKIGSRTSCEMNIDFGLPQGSILAPTLFTVYMDGILRLNLPNSEIICYADDTVAIFHGNDWKSTLEEAEYGLAMLSHWLDINLLTLNTNKTNFVAFRITEATGTNLAQLRIHNDNCENKATTATYNCSCNSIAKVDHVKYLGVMVDQNLNFKKHISYISKKARKCIYIMKTIRQASNDKIKMLVYKTLCQSLFQYCVGVWGGAATTHLAEAERAQRAVLKVMMGKPRRYPTNELLKEASVLSVRQLFVLRAITSCHCLPSAQNLTKRKRHRSRPLPLPKINTTFASRLPKYAHTFTYNSVCRIIDIHNTPLAQAKHEIKKWIMSLSFMQTEKLVRFSEMVYRDNYPPSRLSNALLSFLPHSTEPTPCTSYL